MAGEKKLAGKYDTPEAMEKAYLELEAKLGQQGAELGEIKKGLATYQEWATKATPIVDWYAKTFQPNADKWDAFLKGGANANANGNGNGAAAVAAADAQARQVASRTQEFDWMTPEEQERLVAKVRTAILDQTLKPWTDSFTKEAQGFAANLQAQMQNSHKSFTDVLWQTLSRVIPKEKMDEVKAFHSAALRFADPSKIDPMQMGDEFMTLTSEKARLEARTKELEEKLTSFEKQSVPSLFGSPSPDTAAPNDTEAPTSREDRFKAVMNDVVTTHGTEGARTLFDVPSLAR